MTHSRTVRGAIVGSLLGILGCGDPPADASAAASAPIDVVAEPEPAPSPVVKEREPVASPETPEEFVGKHVLIAVGTPLFVAAKPDAASIVMRRRDEHDVHARAFEVVGHENGLLALVRAKPESRCDDGLPELDPYEPKFFVAPEQVARVLAREAAATFPDGTSVSLRPGVHVRDGATVDAGGVAFPFAVDPRDVSTAFTPTMATRPEELPDRIALGTTLRSTDHEILADEALFADAGGALVLSRKSDGGTELVEVLNGCATLRARVDTAPIDDRRTALARARAAGILGSSALGGESIVAAAAPFTWADGTAGGKIGAEQRFASYTGAKPRKGKKKCFHVDTPESRVEPFDVCFASKHVTTHDPFASMIGIGGLGLSGEFHSALEGEIGGLYGSAIGDIDGAGLGSAGGDMLGGLGVHGRGGEGDGGLGSMGGLGSAEGFGSRGGGTADAAVPETPDVRMTTGSIFVDGALEPSTVKAKVATSKSGVEYCAESASPVATGTLNVTFTVGANGKPSAVNVSGLPAIDDCVQRSIERWKLAKTEGTTTVSFEITLAREDP